MITVIVILTSIVVFFIALFSPAVATRIQVRARKLPLSIQNVPVGNPDWCVGL